VSGYFIYLLLARLTGSPLLTLVALAVVGLSVDQATLGILPGPVRLFRRWRRAGKLERELAVNPHNRTSRFELADLLISQRRFAKALTILSPNVAAGDDDAATLFLMGVAARGAGHPQQAETFLSTAAEQDPDLRLGAILLELGRARLLRGDARAALEPLETFLQRRKSTVEGRVLLAQALESLGEGARARTLRIEAWREYATSPRYVQRSERPWAWRLQPWRPVALVLGVVVAGGLLLHAAQNLQPTSRPAAPSASPLHDPDGD
jgi:tetratricopeptide (TPR) repeat protein